MLIYWAGSPLYEICLFPAAVAQIYVVPSGQHRTCIIFETCSFLTSDRSRHIRPSSPGGAATSENTNRRLAAVCPETNVLTYSS